MPLAIAILSVRLFVRLSHEWISQKRCKPGSPNLHRRLPGRLYTVFHKRRLFSFFRIYSNDD